MSELLRRLDQQLQQVSDPVLRSELSARRAAYLARIGRFDDARALIGELRSVAGSRGFEKIGIWVILCEGILEHYSNVSSNACDRIMRAQRLSVAFKDAALVPVTSAWRAFVEFEQSHFANMSEAAALALSSAQPDDYETLARVSATLSYSFALVGERDTSQFWFERAHRHSVAVGDQAMLEALMHNRASFGLACCRINACFGGVDPKDVAMVRVAIESARSFHRLIGSKSLGHLNDLCAARLLMLEGNFADAMHELEQLLGRGPFAQSNFSDDVSLLDRCYCLAALGQVVEALNCYSEMADVELIGLDPDDRMIGARLQVLLATIDPRFGNQGAANARFEMRRSEFESFRSNLLHSLQPFFQQPQ